MTIKIGRVKFCTDVSSPEILLLYIVSILTLVLLNNELISGRISLIYGVLSGFSIYLIISIIKNIVAKFMDSDAACKIPLFNIHE